MSLQMTKNKIYLVTWVDSASHSGWAHTDELKPRLAIQETVGFYVSETKEALCLALSKGITPGFCPYGDLISIPKSTIRKKRVVKL